MAATTNLTISPADGWVLVASSPGPLTLKSNCPEWMGFQLAIAAVVPAAEFIGEVHSGETSWET